jgi:predicted DNA-binding protein
VLGAAFDWVKMTGVLHRVLSLVDTSVGAVCFNRNSESMPRDPGRAGHVPRRAARRIHRLGVELAPVRYRDTLPPTSCIRTIEMPVSIRLGDELEERLTKASKRLRVAKTEVIKRSLAAFLDQIEPGTSAYELGKDLFGADDSMPTTVSSTYKRRLRAKLRAKHRR